MPEIDWMIQSGPCALCGAANYPLSYGGPTICPTCDMDGPPRKGDKERIAALEAENVLLRSQIDAQADGGTK